MHHPTSSGKGCWQNRMVNKTTPVFRLRKCKAKARRPIRSCPFLRSGDTAKGARRKTQAYVGRAVLDYCIRWDTFNTDGYTNPYFTALLSAHQFVTPLITLSRRQFFFRSVFADLMDFWN